ncbi:hypothetical protein MtrunA17_Chr8g0343591 [Medicago truncatula]|uniref:Uncharacterized protein n=1 Tax=Medicago truncatula TaxID=3880 RepID=A0A396GG40_MEDTR|nr:hypothetical protein MtrunA17_Chr8g0343591 [Medicago truncatula]
MTRLSVVSIHQFLKSMRHRVVLHKFVSLSHSLAYFKTEGCSSKSNFKQDIFSFYFYPCTSDKI